MISLKRNCGLDILLDDQGTLAFGEEVVPVEPEARLKKDMEEVLLDPSAKGPEELYDMYRGVLRQGDEEKIKNSGLRYDITVIKPGFIGQEFIKTAGHYHPEKKGTGLTYPEVYEVIYGTAHYFLQELVPGETEVRQAVLMEARAGDRVLIPPNFGHITINPGKEYLVMANWVAKEFSSDYAPIKEKGGGAYFEIKSPEEDTEFVPNQKHNPLPSMTTWKPVEAKDLNILKDKPFYVAFLDNSDGFKYLAEPEKHKEKFRHYMEKAVVVESKV